MRLPIALLLLLSSSLAQATIMVDFNGTLDGLTDIPFNAGDSFTGSFELDETVIPTGTTLKTFSGAVGDFQLNIDGNSFTGVNGRYRQFNNNTADFIRMTIGHTIGTVTGSVTNSGTTYSLESVSVEWNGFLGELFTDPAVIASNLNILDFGTYHVIFDFRDSDNNLFRVRDNPTQITFGSASPVPVPAAVWLFGSGLVGLLGFSKKKPW